jgi:integrase
VIASLRKLESEGKYETCYRIRQKIETIFSFAEIEGHCIGNPAKGLQQILTKPQPKSHNSLPISELQEFLRKMDADTGSSPTTLLAMKFLILTFVRTSELRFADWKEFEIDCSEPLWVIPAERMKMRKTHHVPLSRQAVRILEKIQQYSGTEGYVFPQVYNQTKAMSENTLLYFSNRLGYAGRNTIHGFRSVASTVLNESRIWHPDIIELQLAHQESNKVRKAYNRAEHLDERRKMMEWWSDYVDSNTASKDVNDLHSKRQSSAL